LSVRRSVVDRFAFEQLHQRLHKPVWRKVSYLIQHEEDAKDIVQETFLKLWRDGPLFGPSANVDAWVYRVALNGGKDYLKSAWRRRNISLDQDLSTRGDDGVQQYKGEEGMEERICEAALCSQVLGQLKEMERTCLVLSVLWKLKQSEIAAYIRDILGREVTVKQDRETITPLARGSPCST
jgi:RNA polymerase sigma-70 factor (ECF subfamily)